MSKVTIVDQATGRRVEVLGRVAEIVLEVLRDAELINAIKNGSVHYDWGNGLPVLVEVRSCRRKVPVGR